MEQGKTEAAPARKQLRKPGQDNNTESTTEQQAATGKQQQPAAQTDGAADAAKTAQDPQPGAAGAENSPASPATAALAAPGAVPAAAVPQLNPAAPLPSVLEHGAAYLEMAKRMRDQAEHLVEMVDVVAPKAFKLTLDNGAVVNLMAGAQSVHRFVAEHWYAIANGLKPYARPVPVAPAVPDDAYKQATEEVNAARMKFDYAVKNLAGYFKVAEETVRAELAKRVKPELVATQ